LGNSNSTRLGSTGVYDAGWDRQSLPWYGGAMSLTAQHKCDTPGCTATHGEANNWWAVDSMGRVIHLYPWADARRDEVLDDCKHFCGQTHALQFVSSEMGAK